MLYDNVELPVEIIRTKTRRGKLFAVTFTQDEPGYKRCYPIRAEGETPFAVEGDSGFLVYLVCGGEKIPFAYVCMRIPESNPEGESTRNVYICRSLKSSMDKLLVNRRWRPCLRQCDGDQNNNWHANIGNFYTNFYDFSAHHGSACRCMTIKHIFGYIFCISSYILCMYK